MLDISSCPASVQSWLTFKHSISNGLGDLVAFSIKPAFDICLVLFALGYFGILRRFKAQRTSKQLSWQRSLPAILIGILFSGLLLLSSPGLALAYQGLVRLVPADSGESAEAIVILGRGKFLAPQRAESAATLWRSQRAPLIFVSGNHQEFLDLVRELKQRGIPDATVDGEFCSKTTEENAEFTASALFSRGIRRILLVTDPPHLMRSLLTFQSLGFTVLPYPSPLPEELNRRDKTMLTLQEYSGLVSYALQGRFFPRTTTY
ncbi:YdcF family protein [Phormidium sp. CLA17]|uniref:YdcF family protein n=1 Tax=Leptolyngbya sp. Cla-17 TaxID=2803751 RepID=UPI0014932248|nr:YdcF family protein [Leptolyngbya sp. Cla-17]MBM0742775.1 YdcF family protein [Leptolyngbya sp. Cla-17]